MISYHPGRSPTQHRASKQKISSHASARMRSPKNPDRRSFPAIGATIQQIPLRERPEFFSNEPKYLAKSGALRPTSCAPQIFFETRCRVKFFPPAFAPCEEYHEAPPPL